MRLARMRCITRLRSTQAAAGDGFLPSPISIHRTLRVRKMRLRNTAATGLERKPEPIWVVLLDLAWALPARKSLRDLAHALDERLHHRTQGPISHRHNRYRGLNAQINWELLERMGSAVDLQDRLRQSCNEFSAADEVAAQMNRERCDDQARLLQSTFPERASHERIAQCIQRRHGPRLIHEIGKSELAPSPLALRADDHNVWIIEQHFRIQLLGETTLDRVFR